MDKNDYELNLEEDVLIISIPAKELISAKTMVKVIIKNMPNAVPDENKQILIDFINGENIDVLGKALKKDGVIQVL